MATRASAAGGAGAAAGVGSAAGAGAAGAGRGFHRGDGRAIALLRAELGQYRQVELARQRVDRRRAVREPHGQHADAADRTEQRAQLGGGDVVIEGAEVQAERGALEQGRCRSYTRRQLGLHRFGVGAADPHLRQAHLAEPDLEC